MARGALTDEVKMLSKVLLGYEITQIELRMMPYLMSTLLDNMAMDRRRINQEENGILNKWESKGFVLILSDFRERRVFVTPEFYKAVSEILMIGYCSDMLADPAST